MQQNGHLRKWSVGSHDPSLCFLQQRFVTRKRIKGYKKITQHATWGSVKKGYDGPKVPENVRNIKTLLWGDLHNVFIG